MAPAHDHRHAPGGVEWGEIGDALVLDAEVMAPALEGAIAWLRPLLDADRGVERILDVGSGPGVGSCLAAQAFPEARVVAMDGSADLLERTRIRARDLGVDARVEVVCAALGDGDGLPPVEPVDLVWASMVLHHVHDAEGALRDLARVLRPGGWLALSEFGAPLAIVADEDDLVRSGRWSAWQRAAAEGLATELHHDHHATDWAARLRSAGFGAVDARECRVEHRAPLTTRERRWVARSLERTCQMAGDRLDRADRAALDQLLDPGHAGGVALRPDLFIRTSRVVHVGRAPGRHPGGERRAQRRKEPLPAGGALRLSGPPR